METDGRLEFMAFCMGCLVATGLTIVAASMVIQSRVETLRDEAVKRGYAERFVNESKNADFRWIEPTP